MMMRLFGWLALSFTLALSSPARAEEDPAIEADALIAEGVALRREGNEREALERFTRAHALHPTPRSAGQMGLAAKSLRSYLAAERHLKEALAAENDPWVEKNREALALAMDIVSKELGWLDVRADVSDAELYVNGALAATLPLAEPLRVVAGQLTVEVRATGYLPTAIEATLPAETTKALEVKLQPAPPPDPTPNAQPPEPAPLPLPEPADVEAAPSWTPWIVSTAVVGGVGLTLGAAFGIRTLVVKDERDAICPEATCSSQEGVDLDDEARAMALGSTVSFVVGGVGAAAALILFLVEPEAPITADAHGFYLRF